MKDLTREQKDKLIKAIEDVLKELGLGGWFILAWDIDIFQSRTYFDGSKEVSRREIVQRLLSVCSHLIEPPCKPGLAMVDGPVTWGK